MVKKISRRESHLKDEPFKIAITNGIAREKFDAVFFSTRSNRVNRYLQRDYERKLTRVFFARIPISPFAQFNSFVGEVGLEPTLPFGNLIEFRSNSTFRYS